MTRSLGVRTPLKITFGGSLVPSAATASATVKLRFSALQVSTATVRLPVNSREQDQPLQLPEITSAEQALELVGKLAAFSDWQGNEPLVQAITKVNDVLVDMRLKSLLTRRQSTITDYFS